jgi:DNA polymerase-3 subunit alpha
LPFTHLHVHSDRSLPFDGYSTMKELTTRTKELGHTAIALTDHGSMSGIMALDNACKELKKEADYDIKPIVGCEFYFVPDVSVRERGYFHMVLLAKDQLGLKNLYELDTLAAQNIYYKPRIDWGILSQHHEGVICLSACLASIINTDQGEQWALKFKQLFGSDFYLEIQPNTLPEQKDYNHKLVSLSANHNIPLVATCDAHYSWKEQADEHRKWIGNNKEDKGYYPTDDFYLMSEEEVRKGLVSQELPDWAIDMAIENAEAIASECNVSLAVEGNHYPVYPTDDPLEEVKRICRAGWKEKLSHIQTKEEFDIYAERILYELPILEKCNYLNYLLITHDILSWCKKQGIPTGPGRGSSGGSLVCYLMDITKVDPIKHGLLFERFVSPDRITAPDVDNDVSKARRQEVIDYIKEKYGYVYNIRTFNYLQAKGAVQRAGQALGMEPKEIIALSKSIDSLDQIKDHEELVKLARSFEGRIHAFGCHASAVLVFPDDPTNYCPIEKQGDTFLAVYDYHDLERFNLLKEDILGLATLDIINEAVGLTGEQIDIDNLPLDDHSVYDIFATGQTKGIFQCESSGMAHLAKQMKVDNFNDVVALIALYRPGPLDSGMTQHYISGKNGETVEYPHPDLEPILKPTYGVMVYQESVMRIVQVMAGMTAGQADEFRRIIGRKELDKIDAAVAGFVEKSIENGYSEDVARTVGDWIKASGRYIFNLSHATEYAKIAHITAYLKTKYPIQFMTAVLNNEIGNTEKTAEYVQECKRLGIQVLPPSIKHSKPRHTIEGDAIRFGTNAIKNVGSTEFIPADSFDEFIDKNTIDNGTLEALIKAGCFPESRPVLLSKLDWIKQYGKRIDQCKTKIKEFIEKGNQKKVEEWQEKLSQVPAFDGKPKEVDEAALEAEILGMYFTASPFDPYKDELSINTWTWKDFESEKENAEVIIGGMIQKIKKHIDKKGNEMAFLGVQTHDGGTVDVTIFASDWVREKDKIDTGNIVRIKGRKNSSDKMLGKMIHKIA